jgi:60 kDa SS-A/Ro ribonucleoprotein
MTNYGKHFSTRKTPQSQVIPGRQDDMAPNNAGGVAFTIDPWSRLDRFIVLGAEGGTFYIGERELTVRNATTILECIKLDGVRVVNRIVEISQAGRAPKNDPALFALALCASNGDAETKQAAFAALPKVARIFTHLARLVEDGKALRGWGRGWQNAVGSWYNDKEPHRLAYQVVKYRNRDGWTHRDMLRVAHPKPPTAAHDALYSYIVRGENVIHDGLDIIIGFERAQAAENEKQIVGLIDTYGLTREMIPTQFLNSPKVWAALLVNMPMTAMIRNLGKMSNVGLLAPMSDAAHVICERLRDTDRITKARVHPLSVLVALKIYEQGHGMRGKLSWEPVAQVVDALDDAFYGAFGNVEPTGKRVMLALDVSASMTGPNIAGMPIAPREGSAAMALVTARTEAQHMFTVFSSGGTDFRNSRRSGISTISLSPRQRLDDVVKQLSGFPHGGTDCALPMIYAQEKGMLIDLFVVFTDSETWAGHIHPSQALQEYRNKVNPGARLCVVGMVSNGFSIADPNDAGMLDVVGFDTATPNLIAGFGRGEF